MTPNACDLEDRRIGQVRARAWENMVGVALANYAGPPKNNGHSCAYGAVSFERPEGEARDTPIVEAGGGEGVYIAEFDMEKIRAYRDRETWGNAYRKARAYGLLTSDEVRSPFLRRDARR